MSDQPPVVCYDTYKRAESRILDYIQTAIDYYGQNKTDLNVLILLKDLITSYVILERAHPVYIEDQIDVAEAVYKEFEDYVESKS